MIHDYLNAHRGLIDSAAAALAGVAWISLLQGVALVVTILSGLGSLSLVWLRWRNHMRGEE